MKLGKLTSDELKENVLNVLRAKRKETLMSSALGEDCGAVKLGETILITSDPITAEVKIEKLGSLCVSVCCNDIVANGGEPIAMTLTIIMPPHCSATDVKTIMVGAQNKAEELNVDILGGHTEFSDCVTRPIVSGTAIGRVKRLLKKTAIKKGDKLLVTKFLGIEGTCILADIQKDEFPKAEKDILAQFNKMLDVSEESKQLSELEEVRAMHDITEGGVLGAVAEVCQSIGVGAILKKDRMPIHELTTKLCRQMEVNPLRLISSGSMLIIASDVDKVIARLNEKDIAVTQIGEIVEDKRVLLIDGDSTEEIDIEKDEMYKFTGEKVQ